MAATNLCVAIFRLTLVREPMQTARYFEEDSWENGSQTVMVVISRVWFQVGLWGKAEGLDLLQPFPTTEL